MSPIPPLLSCVVRCCAMEPSLMHAFWFALVHAEGKTAVQFRQQLLIFESRPVATAEATARFWDTHMQPRQLVALIESLVEEGRLARHTATALEDHLLAHVLADGRWQ